MEQQPHSGEGQEEIREGKQMGEIMEGNAERMIKTRETKKHRVLSHRKGDSRKLIVLLTGGHIN